MLLCCWHHRAVFSPFSTDGCTPSPLSIDGERKPDNHVLCSSLLSGIIFPVNCPYHSFWLLVHTRRERGWYWVMIRTCPPNGTAMERFWKTETVKSPQGLADRSQSVSLPYSEHIARWWALKIQNLKLEALTSKAERNKTWRGGKDTIACLLVRRAVRSPSSSSYLKHRPWKSRGDVDTDAFTLLENCKSPSSSFCRMEVNQ